MTHRWSRDGETCLRCGDKDWRASADCIPKDNYVAELEAERDRLRERVSDLNGISMSLAADLLRFIGEDESREADCLRARIVGWRRQWDEISARAALQEGK